MNDHKCIRNNKNATYFQRMINVQLLFFSSEKIPFRLGLYDYSLKLLSSSHFYFIFHHSESEEFFYVLALKNHFLKVKDTTVGRGCTHHHKNDLIKFYNDKRIIKVELAVLLEFLFVRKAF